MITGIIAKTLSHLLAKILNAVAGAIALWLRYYVRRKKEEKKNRAVTEALKAAVTEKEREDAARLAIDSF